MPKYGPTLDRRALNRATLARQHLLARTGDTPLEVVRHLVGLQAQAPIAPYYALWSRVDRFTPDQLADRLLGRDMVRLVVMRGTVHLVAAEDAWALRSFTEPVFARTFGVKGSILTTLDGIDLDAVAATAHALLAATPLSYRDLGTRLADAWPGHDPRALAQAAVFLLPLVQIPPRAIWGRSGQPTYSPADVWLAGRTADAPPAPDAGEIVLRYLAAFGPATVADLQAWCGVTRLRPLVDTVRDRLVSFTDPDGRELLDLPHAPRPDPDTTAPVRLIGPFDNLVLSHADRTRVVCGPCRRRLITINGQVPGPVLVDGEVVGTWRVDVARETASVDITVFHDDIGRADLDAIEDEARRLAAFAEPAAVGVVTIGSPS